MLILIFFIIPNWKINLFDALLHLLFRIGELADDGEAGVLDEQHLLPRIVELHCHLHTVARTTDGDNVSKSETVVTDARATLEIRLGGLGGRRSVGIRNIRRTRGMRHTWFTRESRLPV